MNTQEVTIDAAERQPKGTNEAGRLRRQGFVPAVVYGAGKAGEHIAVDPRPLHQVLKSERGLNTLIHLKVGGRELPRVVMLREVQFHPVTDRILHADFLTVDLQKKITVSVPIHLVGVPVGVKSEGGLLEFVHRVVQIRVLAAKIPDSLDLDVSNLHLGQHLEARQVPLPDGAELIGSPTDTVVTVVAVKHEEEAVAAAAPVEGAAPAEGAAAPATPEKPEKAEKPGKDEKK